MKTKKNTHVSPFLQIVSSAVAIYFFSHLVYVCATTNDPLIPIKLPFVLKALIFLVVVFFMSICIISFTAFKKEQAEKIQLGIKIRTARLKLCFCFIVWSAALFMLSFLAMSMLSPTFPFLYLKIFAAGSSLLVLGHITMQKEET